MRDRLQGARESVPTAKGGWKLTRPKGKRKRSIPIPVQLIPQLREHFAALDAAKIEAEELARMGPGLVPPGRVTKSTLTTTGKNGERS